MTRKKAGARHRSTVPTTAVTITVPIELAATLEKAREAGETRSLVYTTVLQAGLKALQGAKHEA